jgi:hypothetical protein
MRSHSSPLTKAQTPNRLIPPLARTIPTSLTLYTISAISVFALIPYTITFMGPMNSALTALAHQSSSSSSSAAEVDIEKGYTTTDAEQDADRLIRRWTKLNYGRMALELTSAVLGLWAVVSRPESVAVVVEQLGQVVADEAL